MQPNVQTIVCFNEIYLAVARCGAPGRVTLFDFSGGLGMKWRRLSFYQYLVMGRRGHRGRLLGGVLYHSVSVFMSVAWLSVLFHVFFSCFLAGKIL